MVLTDVDGNIYNTIKLGDQVWMVENLRTTKFNDGTSILENTYPDNVDDWSTDTGTYQWASTLDLNNDVDEEIPFDYYGIMYNEAAVSSGKLAPEGWRIPSEQDWIELINFISDDGYIGEEGTALKSSSGWNPNSGNGIDAYGFKGLPNGYVDAFATPKADAIICNWATSNNNPTLNERTVINLYQATVGIYSQSKLLGSGVRCIKN